MSKAVFTDFRRENTDLLKGDPGPLKDKFCAEAEEEAAIPLRKLDSNQRRNGGPLDQSENSGRVFVKERRRRYEGQRRLQNYCYKFLEQPSGWHNIYHTIL